uniref:Uncharacterized protein n=1 Tax=Eutreptiella gymnastica TaxID=73025 RepID=A0A7S4D2V0_9EUGL
MQRIKSPMMEEERKKRGVSVSRRKGCFDAGVTCSPKAKYVGSENDHWSSLRALKPHWFVFLVWLGGGACCADQYELAKPAQQLMLEMTLGIKDLRCPVQRWSQGSPWYRM